MLPWLCQSGLEGSVPESIDPLYCSKLSEHGPFWAGRPTRLFGHREVLTLEEWFICSIHVAVTPALGSWVLLFIAWWYWEGGGLWLAVRAGAALSPLVDLVEGMVPAGEASVSRQELPIIDLTYGAMTPSGGREGGRGGQRDGDCHVIVNARVESLLVLQGWEVVLRASARRFSARTVMVPTQMILGVGSDECWVCVWEESTPTLADWNRVCSQFMKTCRSFLKVHTGIPSSEPL